MTSGERMRELSQENKIQTGAGNQIRKPKSECRKKSEIRVTSKPCRSILFVSMQSEVTLALTLTLSPRRGNLQWVGREKSLAGEHSPALEKVLPLPAGEGWGEGERAFQMNSYGLLDSVFGFLSDFGLRISDFFRISDFGFRI